MIHDDAYVDEAPGPRLAMAGCLMPAVLLVAAAAMAVALVLGSACAALRDSVDPEGAVGEPSGAGAPGESHAPALDDGARTLDDLRRLDEPGAR